MPRIDLMLFQAFDAGMCTNHKEFIFICCFGTVPDVEMYIWLSALNVATEISFHAAT